MAGGFAKDGAVQEQIDATVEDAIRRARSELPEGESRTNCEECGKQIPVARREAVPGVRLCVACKRNETNTARLSAATTAAAAKTAS